MYYMKTLRIFEDHLQQQKDEILTEQVFLKENPQ